MFNASTGLFAKTSTCDVTLSTVTFLSVTSLAKRCMQAVTMLSGNKFRNMSRRESSRLKLLTSLDSSWSGCEVHAYEHESAQSSHQPPLPVRLTSTSPVRWRTRRGGLHTLRLSWLWRSKRELLILACRRELRRAILIETTAKLSCLLMVIWFFWLTNPWDDAANHEGEDDEGDEAEEDFGWEEEVDHLSRMQFRLGVRFRRQPQVRSEQDSSHHANEEQDDLHGIATAAATTTPAWRHAARRFATSTPTSAPVLVKLHRIHDWFHRLFLLLQAVVCDVKLFQLHQPFSFFLSWREVLCSFWKWQCFLWCVCLFGEKQAAWRVEADSCQQLDSIQLLRCKLTSYCTGSHNVMLKT